MKGELISFFRDLARPSGSYGVPDSTGMGARGNDSASHVRLNVLALACAALLWGTSPTVASGVSELGGPTIVRADAKVVAGWVCVRAQEVAQLVVHAGGPPPGAALLGVASPVAVAHGESALPRCPRKHTPRFFEVSLHTAAKNSLGPGRHPAMLSLRYANRLVAVDSSPIWIEVTGTRDYVHRNARILSDCRAYNDDLWRRILRPVGACQGVDPWNIRGTNEDSRFRDARYFLPNDRVLAGTPWAAAGKPYWSYAFSSMPGGAYSVQWEIDKISHRDDLDQYTGAFLNDVSFSRSHSLAENLFVEINAQLLESVAQDDASAGPARNRFTIGFKASWDGRKGRRQTAYLEINLYKTDNFDLCTATTNLGGWVPKERCDVSGLYDRRTFYDVGEAVYYDVSALTQLGGLPQQALQPGGPRVAYRIPVSELFRRYPWVEPPASWAATRIEGAYIGFEVWGAGRMRGLFDGYRVFRFRAD